MMKTIHTQLAHGHKINIIFCIFIKNSTIFKKPHIKNTLNPKSSIKCFKKIVNVTRYTNMIITLFTMRCTVLVFLHNILFLTFIFVWIILCHRNTILKTTMKVISHWTLDKEKLPKTIVWWKSLINAYILWLTKKQNIFLLSF